MPTTKQLRYDDWSAGDWGDRSEFNAPPKSFSGLNVVVYDNGFIGPRAGLREMTYTGSMSGTVYGIYTPGMINRPIMIFAGSNVYIATGDSGSLGTVSNEATLSAEPTKPVIATWYDPNQNVYFTSPTDRVYSFNMTSAALNTVLIHNSGTTAAGTATVHLCRDRLYAGGVDSGSIGGDTSFAQRVYYSDAADFSDFVNGGFFEVGYFQQVNAMMESQNSLLFGLATTEPSFYALVGAVPTGDLRKVNMALGSISQTELVDADNNNFYFWTGYNGLNQVNPYLAAANGAKFDEETYKHIRLGGTKRFGHYLKENKILIYVSNQGNNAWIRQNGVWTKHTFGVSVSGPVTNDGPRTGFILAYGAPATAVKAYQLEGNPTQPSAATSTANPGDNSTTCFDAHFSLPAYMSQGKEVRVRRVFVDFMKYNVGHSSTNHFQVAVRQFGQYNLPGQSTTLDTTVTDDWTEAQSLADSDGVMDRHTVRVGQQGKAAGYQISILGIRGVAIKAITVEFDEDEGPDGRTI